MHQVSGLLYDEFSSIALLLIIYVLYHLSRRLGEALQMKPYYYLFIIGGIIIFISWMVNSIILFNQSYISDNEIVKYIFIVKLIRSFGVTLCLLPALKYWGWLIKEIFN
ncbi:MAG: hypothetical protein SCH39_08205 [Methanosarcinales archaeon]|nr:hypothetical protein [ANME-2 cluster archaeon]MDF1531856.1 hypothetical protein [ANME-2 cluster archaeon]MDW7776299.1 hypothetical protein [Methanosarcinales archaeon]